MKIFSAKYFCIIVSNVFVKYFLRRCFESKPYGNRRVSALFKWQSYGARAMSARSCYYFLLSSCGLPTIAELFLSINYHNKSCGDRTIIAGSPYGARSTCLRATVLRFLKISKSADYY